MKIAFFDTKPYDKVAFEPLAKGCDATCSFVNDNITAEAVQALKDVGIRGFHTFSVLIY